MAAVRVILAICMDAGAGRACRLRGPATAILKGLEPPHYPGMGLVSAGAHDRVSRCNIVSPCTPWPPDDAGIELVRRSGWRRARAASLAPAGGQTGHRCRAGDTPPSTVGAGHNRQPGVAASLQQAAGP